MSKKIINQKKSMESHCKQFKTPLYSTVEFEKFLNGAGCILPNKEILDIGCGAGAVTAYFSKKHPETRFKGIDYNKALIELGNQMDRGMSNLSLEIGDWYNLPKDFRNRYDGVYNVHALCCFKSFADAIDALTELNPRWIAFNSLFYDGPLDVLIHIRDYTMPEIKDDDSDGEFNIFSLPMVKGYLVKKGYAKFKCVKFKMPEELPRPHDGQRGTYTVKTEFDERSQFSGPVYLPWCFVLAEKAN